MLAFRFAFLSSASFACLSSSVMSDSFLTSSFSSSPSSF